MVPTAPLVSAPNVWALLGLAAAMSTMAGGLAALVESKLVRRSRVPAFVSEPAPSLPRAA